MTREHILNKNPVHRSSSHMAPEPKITKMATNEKPYKYLHQSQEFSKLCIYEQGRMQESENLELFYAFYIWACFGYFYFLIFNGFWYLLNKNVSIWVPTNIVLLTMWSYGKTSQYNIKEVWETWDEFIAFLTISSK